MTQRPKWIRVAHRAHAGATVAIVVTLLALNLSGILSVRLALTLFLAIEVPLVLAFAVMTMMRFKDARRINRAQGVPFLDAVEAEEPLLRPAIAELRTFWFLGLAIVGRRRIPPGARAFGYTKGSMTLPLVLVGVSLVEMVIVHILVPWMWLRILLLVLTAWGILYILGFFAARVIHPHYVAEGAVHLRWGSRRVLSAPVAGILSIAQHRNHAHTQPALDGDRLILTHLQGTNVLIRVAEPVPAAPPIAKKHVPAGSRVSEVELYVDEPESFVQTVRSLSDSVAM